VVDIGLRNRSAAGNSTIEFHTSTANIDYDTRIQASGGGSNAGEGIITITAANTVMTGNVTGNYFVGNGSLLTGIAGSSYGNANVADYLPTYTGNLVSLTGNVTTTANIAANYFVGNGSLLTGIAGGGSPGGSNTQIQFNANGSFAGDSALTFNSATDTLQIGNITVFTNWIQNINSLIPVTSGTANGRIVIGPGIAGNIGAGVDSYNTTRNARVSIWGTHNKGNTSTRSSGLTVNEGVILTENVTNSSSRAYASVNLINLGGGANSHSWNNTSSSGLVATRNIMQLGGTAVGNTSASVAVGTSSSVFVSTGSTLTTGIGYSAQAEGNVANFTAFSSSGFDLAGSNTLTSYSVLGHSSGGQSTLFRSAADYYFLKNDDNAAQVRLGSLRRYHEFNYTSNSTSGNITINKNNSQVQTIVPTGEITVDGFSNFVTSASDGVNTDQQTDTVTLIIAQGATGYAVNLPAASSTVKYAGGVSTVGTGANTVTMISVTAVNISSTTYYLLTVSPEFE